MFDDLMRTITDYPANRTLFGFWDGVINIMLPFVLASIISVVYVRSHKGPGFNTNFLKTLIILSVTTSVLMMIIGSNIARAFSLVGALSIIRFRTAVKDSIDVGYIFIAIAIGMACGTGFYVIAGTLTVGISIILVTLEKLKFGDIKRDSLLLHTTTDQKIASAVLTSTLDSQLEQVTLISSTELQNENKTERTYLCYPKRDFSEDQLIRDLKTSAGNDCRVSIVYQTNPTPI